MLALPTASRASTVAVRMAPEIRDRLLGETGVRLRRSVLRLVAHDDGTYDMTVRELA